MSSCLSCSHMIHHRGSSSQSASGRESSMVSFMPKGSKLFMKIAWKQKYVLPTKHVSADQDHCMGLMDARAFINYNLGIRGKKMSLFNGIPINGIHRPPNAVFIIFCHPNSEDHGETRPHRSSRAVISSSWLIDFCNSLSLPVCQSTGVS